MIQGHMKKMSTSKKGEEMQRKKLTTKIASILLSAAMLVSSTMTAFATEEAVSVAAEQTEVQTVAETEEDVAPEASAEDAAASEELTEGETVAEEEVTADEEITKEITSEEAQGNVEEAQVLDAEEVQTLDADEVAVAAEEDIMPVGGAGTPVGDTGITFYVDGSTLRFENYTGTPAALPDYTDATEAAWRSSIQSQAITKVIIGDNITGIGAYNFENRDGVYDKLTTVVLSSSVTSIGNFAFYNASSLNVVSESQHTADKRSLHNVTYVGGYAFAGTAIENIIFTGGNVQVERCAFKECSSLEKCTFQKEGEVTLNMEAFASCTNLAEVGGNATLKKVDVSAFSGCSNLSTWNIIKVNEIGKNAFLNCSSLSKNFFGSVTSMGANAISGTQIDKISFANSDIKLDQNALSGAKQLKYICYAGTKTAWDAMELDIPETVENIHWKGSSEKIEGTPSPSLAYLTCEVCYENYTIKEDPDPDPNPETETETDNPDSEHKHSWSAWKTKSPATVFAAEVQTRTCSKCGKTETRTVGKKLTPTITVNAKKIWLQKGQKTSAFKVSGLANGDSVKSYKSSNTKIFTVTNKGVIKAGKKVGKAKLTITLASGMKKVVTVQVQKRQVKTWAIKNLPAKVTIKKGATYTLSPVVSLITSTHKVTYKTSNKKVATVTNAGKIKGVKKGTAVITVKSGTVTKKVKVTVK